MINFGKRIQAAQKLLKITGAEAAHRAEVTQPKWSRIVCGKYNPCVPYSRAHWRSASIKGSSARNTATRTQAKRRARLTAIAAAVGLTFADLGPPISQADLDPHLHLLDGTLDTT